MFGMSFNFFKSSILISDSVEIFTDKEELNLTGFFGDPWTRLRWLIFRESRSILDNRRFRLDGFWILTKNGGALLTIAQSYQQNHRFPLLLLAWMDNPYKFVKDLTNNV